MTPAEAIDTIHQCEAIEEEALAEVKAAETALEAWDPDDWETLRGLEKRLRWLEYTWAQAVRETGYARNDAASQNSLR